MERLIEPELRAMQRAAWDLENERDVAMARLDHANGMLQGYIDQVNENALRVHELEQDLEAARRQSIILVKRVAEANAKEFVLEEERDAALAVLATTRADIQAAILPEYANEDSPRHLGRLRRMLAAALATPSPAAEALLELAEAAETLHRELCRWLNLVDLPIEVLAAEDVVNAAVEKWQRARG